MVKRRVLPVFFGHFSATGGKEAGPYSFWDVVGVPYLRRSILPNELDSNVSLIRVSCSPRETEENRKRVSRFQKKN